MLLLGVVLALGALLGAITIRGVSVGPAGALFAGLALSAYDERLVIPTIVGVVGLSVFTYCVGLTTGPEFVRTFASRLLIMAALVVLLAALAPAAAGLGHLAGLDRAETAGLYAGSLTNTPALAGAQGLLDDAEQGRPVVGYALAYPFGVLGMLAAVLVAARLRRRRRPEVPSGAIDHFSVRVGPACPATVGAVRARLDLPTVIARIQREDREWVPTNADRLHVNDIVSVTCNPAAIDDAVEVIGERLELDLADDRSKLDFRRIVVSNPHVVGRQLAELGLPQRYGATVTRVRRGRHDVLAARDLVLEPGDRVRVVAPPQRMAEIGAELGDDEQRVWEFHPRGFTIGLVIGLLVGVVPLPIPGAGTIELGPAGGPLLVGLLLGWRERTGPLVWQIPHGVSTTLRQLGSLLFLGMAGTSGGAALRDALGSGTAIPAILAGAAITTLAAAGLLLIARWRELDTPSTGGLIAGAQTQPAVLAFAGERTASPQLLVFYAVAVPAAMVVKIIAAQLLVLF